MNVEIESGALQLSRGQTLKLTNGAGNTICANPYYKRKDRIMNDYDDTTAITYEDLVRDPVLVERLHRRAMRLRSIEGARVLSEGARALGRKILAPVDWSPDVQGRPAQG